MYKKIKKSIKIKKITYKLYTFNLFYRINNGICNLYIPKKSKFIGRS